MRCGAGLAFGRRCWLPYALALASTLLWGGVSQAQSVDPPFTVFEGRARSSLLLSNNSLFPLTYVIEPRGFDIAACGDLGFLPLDTARVRVRLSAMSGRIPAKQQRRIFYDADSDSLPSWFLLLVTFSNGNTAPGLDARLQFAHFAYLNRPGRLLQSDVGVESAVFDSVRREVRLTVRNRSDKLTRIQRLALVDATGRDVLVEACPLLPNHSRDFVFPWRDSALPVRAEVRFPGFSLDAPLRAAAPPPKPDTLRR